MTDTITSLGLGATLAIDHACLPMVMSMMQRGMRVDPQQLTVLSDELQSRMLLAQVEIANLTGKVINPASPIQVPELLTELGFRLHARTPTGRVKVDERELNRIKHPVIEQILEYRRMQKLDSTYCQALLRQRDTEDRVHTTIKVTRTDTGRFCVDPDTLVEAPRDLTKYPDGIPLRALHVGDWVYSFDWEKRLVLRQIKWVGPTRTAPTVVVTARNSVGHTMVVRLSPDHLVRSFRGAWLPAGKLIPGQRLCCMVRRGIDDWAWFFPSSKRRGRGIIGGKVKEHRHVYAVTHGMDRLPPRWDVHHRDRNKLNNSPENLELVYHASHMKMHRPKTSREATQAMLDGAPLTIHKRTLQRLARTYGLTATNHTVISVAPGPAMQLWDLEVEDTHCFIGGGIALHNSSVKPNLQNIPVRTTDGKRIRAAFVASPGRVLLSVDYSQIEMRVMAVASGCTSMMQLFLDHRDIHTETAAKLFNLSLEEAGRDEYRYPTKRGGFGIIYDISDRGFYELLLEEGITDWPLERCHDFIEGYFKLYPEIVEYRKEQLTFAYRYGYAKDMFGRIRWIPELLCPIPAVQEAGKRQLYNFPIQSGAQQIIKAAMGELWQQYQKWGEREQNQVWWLMQIHDELLLEVDEAVALAVAVWCKGVMEGAVKLSVPVEVGVKMGRSWGDLKKVQV